DILMHMSVNNKRGMTYGMTHRGFFPMWKLWDEFGIVGSRMIGYWDKHPVVNTNRKGVYATAYVKEGKTLIALGNWTSEPVMVVPDIDWKALGLNPRKVTISAPSIEGYQTPAQYRVGQPVLIGPKDDCLLIVSEK